MRILLSFSGAAVLVLPSVVSAALTARHLPSESLVEEFYAVPNFATDGKDKSTTSNIFSKTTTSKTPTLSFTVRMLLEGNEPSEDDETALLCQIHRFVEERLRQKTGDSAILSNLQQLNWNYTKDTSTWQTEFQVESAFGNGQPMSDWSLIKILELPQEEIKRFVADYVWSLKETAFASTRTLFWGGRLAIRKEPRTVQKTKLLLDTCPPAPTTPTDSPSLVENDPFGGQTEIPFGIQTAIPQPDSDSNRNSNARPLFSAPMRTKDERYPDTLPALYNETATMRNELTMRLIFWIANDHGITNAGHLKSSWLDESFRMLVNQVITSDPILRFSSNAATKIPQIVPHSSNIDQVIPIPCPLASTASSATWICHQIIGQYNLQIDELAIPLQADPAVYTKRIRAALYSGPYEAILRRLDPKLPFRLGDDKAAMQPSWWVPTRKSSETNGKLRLSGFLLGAVFGVVFLGLVGVEFYYRWRIRALQRKQDASRGNLHTLLEEG